MSKDYRIYMEEINDHPEGFSCGAGRRIHSAFFRTDDEDEADVYDDVNAVLFAAEYRNYGYPCRIVPEIPMERRLEILEGGIT